MICSAHDHADAFVVVNEKVPIFRSSLCVVGGSLQSCGLGIHRVTSSAGTTADAEGLREAVDVYRKEGTQQRALRYSCKDWRRLRGVSYLHREDSAG